MTQQPTTQDSSMDSSIALPEQNRLASKDAAARLKADLRRFTGTEHWYRNAIVPSVLSTDGVQYLANEAGAHWLVDVIALAQIAEQAVEATPFQVWKLTVHADHSAKLICSDGDYNEVWRQDIPLTDFPLPEIELWFTNNTLYLPSEH